MSKLEFQQRVKKKKRTNRNPRNKNIISKKKNINQWE